MTNTFLFFSLYVRVDFNSSKFSGGKFIVVYFYSLGLESKNLVLPSYSLRKVNTLESWKFYHDENKAHTYPSFDPYDSTAPKWTVSPNDEG